MALPVPPAPTTRTRTARRLSRSGGSVCSIRILPPLPAYELRQRLRQLDQRLDRKPFTFVREAAPQPLKSCFVAGQTADVGVREGAFVEAAFPVGDRGYCCTLRMAHRAGAQAAVVRDVPEGSDSQFRLRGRPFVFDERPNLEVAAVDAPHQRGLREDTAIEFGALQFKVLVKHLPAAGRGPPCKQAIAFGQNMLRQHFGRGSAVKRVRQGL